MEIKGNAFSIARSGLQAQEVKATQAVAKLNKNLVAAQNQVAASSGDRDDNVAVSDAAVVASENARAAAVAADVDAGDISGPLVDLLQAKTAYKANASALRVTADIEDTAANLLKKRGA